MLHIVYLPGLVVSGTDVACHHGYESGNDVSAVDLQASVFLSCGRYWAACLFSLSYQHLACVNSSSLVMVTAFGRPVSGDG
jgi:hypothetical protein